MKLPPLYPRTSFSNKKTRNLNKGHLLVDRRRVRLLKLSNWFFELLQERVHSLSYHLLTAINFLHFCLIYSCFVSGLAFYLTIIIPIALVVLSNGLVLLFIVRALKKSGKIQSSSDSDNKTDRLYVIIAFTLLFGLTWSFGFLVISNDVIVFQYLFCFFGTFHGFFLFLFFCLRNKSIRSTCENFLGRSWKRATCYEVNTSTIENRHSMEIDIDSASPGTFKQVEEV